MNDLVDATAAAIFTAKGDPWNTALSVLKTISVSLRQVDHLRADSPYSISADWIDSQIQHYSP